MDTEEKVNILLVDDTPAKLMALKSILADMGQNLVEARSGKEALRHLLQQEFAVILLDVMMPVMDGFETAELIRQRERSKHTPIIFVTAISTAEVDRTKGYRLGAVDYIFAPVVPEILKGKVAVFVDLYRHKQQLYALTQTLEQRVAERTAAVLRKDEELQIISQQLWQAAKLATMGELGASIAHELNNPLATVTLHVESLLMQAPPDDPKRRALEVIEQEVERMGNLVANLLQFSRRSQAQISTLDVREEIEKTLELIHYHLRNHRIIVARAFDPDAPLLHADRQQLRQLFLNLFTNASDAMPKGGTLTIRVKAIAEAKSHTRKSQVVIEVADTGVGIAPEDLPKVMEPFFTTKPEGKGTGLGLAICRRIVQEHHGMLDIMSEVGKGTTVRIVLPVTNETNSAHLRGVDGLAE